MAGIKKGRLIAVGAGAACLMAASAAAVWLLSPSDKKQAPTPPEDYELGGDSVQSLDAVLGEEGGTLTALETPQTRGDSGSDASAAKSGEESCVYTYEKLPDESVRKYVESLTDEEDGFSIVNAENQAADAPDYQADSGSVSLAKASAQDGHLLRMDIEWVDDGCQITVTQPQGELKAANSDMESMTYSDAVAFLKKQKPAALGLKGESMAIYAVYPMDGAAVVDGNLCLRLKVCLPNEEYAANSIAGTYLLSGDQQHLYLLEDGSVQECSLG